MIKYIKYIPLVYLLDSVLALSVLFSLLIIEELMLSLDYIWIKGISAAFGCLSFILTPSHNF